MWSDPAARFDRPPPVDQNIGTPANDSLPRVSPDRGDVANPTPTRSGRAKHALDGSSLMRPRVAVNIIRSSRQIVPKRSLWRRPNKPITQIDSKAKEAGSGTETDSASKNPFRTGLIVLPGFPPPSSKINTSSIPFVVN